MDEDFRWKRINLLFPEYYSGPSVYDKEDFDRDYPLEPKFLENGTISSRFNNEYGIQIFLNNKIPDWIQKLDKVDDGQLKRVKNNYFSESKIVYEKVMGDLTSLSRVFEDWRSFVSRYSKDKGWVGNLQNHIQFYDYGSDVHLGDYYNFFPDNPTYNFAPTDVLLKIGKIPKEGLNSEWEKYHLLSNNVSKGGKNKSNTITGNNLVECIKNADLIYKSTPELKEIWELF